MTAPLRPETRGHGMALRPVSEQTCLSTLASARHQGTFSLHPLPGLW
jgi:hypothetical protein